MLIEYFNLLRRPSRIISFVSSIILLLIGGFFSKIIGIKALCFMKESVFSIIGPSLFTFFGWILMVFTFNEIALPIKKEERRKFKYIAVMFAIIILMYTIARQVKDSLMWPFAGEIGISISKAIIPVFAYLFSVYYTLTSKKGKVSHLVYIAVIPIMIYFIIFSFGLYDNPYIGDNIDVINIKSKEILKKAIAAKENSLIAGGIEKGSQIFTETINSFIKNPGFIINFKQALTGLWGQWHVVLFYILAEVFANSVLSVGAWQIINSQITGIDDKEKKDRAKRITLSLLLLAQFPTLLAGSYFKSITKIVGGEKYGLILKITTGILILSCIMLFLNNYLFFKSNLSIDKDISAVKKKKRIIDSDSVSAYEKKSHKFFFILIALLTVFYGLTTSALEGFFKSSMKYLSEDLTYVKSIGIHATEITKQVSKTAYSAISGSNLTVQSILSFGFMIFVTPILMNYMSWKSFASITPMSALIGSLLLFGIPLIAFISGGTFFGFEAIHLIPFIGQYVVGIFKTLKYGAADATKNLLVNRLTFHQKNIVAKYDGNLSRIGKSGAAAVMGITALSTGLRYIDKPFVIGLLIFGILFSICWIGAVIYLDKKVEQVVLEGKEQEEEHNKEETK